MDPLDLRIRLWAGPRPEFDPVMRDFLDNVSGELRERLRPGSLLRVRPLDEVPWLWRLDFATRGLALDESGRHHGCDHHVVGVRFLPDYLRRADRFEALALFEPARAFHPNLRDGFVCLEVYPGEPIVEICESLHRLFSWKLRQLSETDALNPTACEWGRANLDRLPLDARPLFGRALAITLEPAEQPK